MHDIVARSDQRSLGPLGPVLAQADGGHEPVAQAKPALRFFSEAAFADIIVDRFTGAAVADGTVGALEGLAKIAEVADALAGQGAGFIGQF